MKWYVYELVDPRDDSAFYVGKGCGYRMNNHFSNGASENVKRAIKGIQSAGYKPFPRQVAFFYDEREALRFEGERIRELKPIANVRLGNAKPIRKPQRYTLIGTVCDLLCGKVDTWTGAGRLHRFSRVPDLHPQLRQLIDIGLTFCYRFDQGLVGIAK